MTKSLVALGKLEAFVLLALLDSSNVNEGEIKNRLAAAEFDAKLVAGHRLDGLDGSHPNLMEI
jgi:hypothetical protein